MRCIFRSQFEEDVSTSLTSHGVPFTYEADQLLYFDFFNQRTAIYTPDFTLTKWDGAKMFIEAKGWLTDAHRRKIEAIRDQNPDVDLRILFQRSSNTLEGLSTTYGQWATGIDLSWADADLPEPWLQELLPSRPT